MAVLPIVDLKVKAMEGGGALSRQLLEVGRDPGFFYLTGHGIPRALINNMFDTSKHFFQKCPDHVRQQYSSRSGEPGYSGPGKEKLSGLGRGDLKESYHFKTFTSFPEVELPSELDTQRSNLKHFSKECERVGSVLLEGFAMGLGLPRDYLTKAHTGEQNRFRMLHYPPVSLDGNTHNIPAATENDIRAGTHSDYGSVTLLFQQPEDEGGLQVWSDGGWLNVPYIEDAIVVNIGDALEFWTAGQLRSTIHRVTFPKSSGPAQSRYSIPFFVTADDATVLEPLLTSKGATTRRNAGVAFFGDLARVKGYLSLDPITAKEHRLRREDTISGYNSIVD